LALLEIAQIGRRRVRKNVMAVRQLLWTHPDISEEPIVMNMDFVGPSCLGLSFAARGSLRGCIGLIS
jgi:hypothetical protein